VRRRLRPVEQPERHAGRGHDHLLSVWPKSRLSRNDMHR
jgi:hypothetical protein